MNNIRAILFDMGGTLREPFKRRDQNSPEVRSAIGTILGILGIGGDVDEYVKRIFEGYYSYRKWATESGRELREWGIWSQWILPDYPNKDLLKEKALEINEIFKNSMGVSPLKKGAVDVIGELYGRGYKLGLVSNTFSSVSGPQLLEKNGIRELFDVIVLSSVHGSRKPNPDMLLEATDKMGIDPSNAAYVGDKIEKDIIAARKAGIGISVLVLNPGKIAYNPDYPDIKPDFVVRDLKELLNIF